MVEDGEQQYNECDVLPDCYLVFKLFNATLVGAVIILIIEAEAHLDWIRWYREVCVNLNFYNLIMC